MKKVILFFALMVGVSFITAAQTQIQANQTSRIKHGVVNGEITRKEAKILKKQQRHIQQEKILAKADGVVTRREKANIRRDQKIANRSIYVQKHDFQSRLY